MKLLLVTHYMPPHHGGIERIGEDHAWVAARAGIDVTWVASRVPGDAELREAMPWGRAVRVGCYNGFEQRFAVPYPWWGRAAGRAVRALVREADLVHAHDLLYPGTSLAFAAARSLGKPTLLTQHVAFVHYPNPLVRWVERLAFATIGQRNLARAGAVAYYNDGALAWVDQLGARRGDAVFLPNPVDETMFRPARSADEKRELRAKHGLPTDRPLVLFVGRLVPKKGAHLVVAAAEPDYHVLLVAERGTVEVGERRGVEVRPFQERERLAELMRSADVLVLPAHGEGFPLVVQEAMASGLAVILGDDPGYRRQLDPGAVVTIGRDAGALRAALRRLVDHPREREAMGALARASALRHWGRAACDARLLELYRRLTTRAPLRSRS